MIDQGSGIKIIYPDLYQGLGLTLKDLTRYDTPLITFDSNRSNSASCGVGGLRGGACLFLVHKTFKKGYLWLHSKGIVPSSLHQKVKFPID